MNLSENIFKFFNGEFTGNLYNFIIKIILPTIMRLAEMSHVYKFYL